jgi:RNA polymerase sigma factor (sigma-70 family)
MKSLVLYLKHFHHSTIPYLYLIIKSEVRKMKNNTLAYVGETTLVCENGTNLYEIASKAAHHTVKFLHSKNPTSTTDKLLKDFVKIENVDSETLDLIQIAAIELWENRNNETEVFKKACSAVRRYIYSRHKQRQEKDFGNQNDEMAYAENEIYLSEALSTIAKALRSPQQLKVFNCLKMGYSGKEIAAEMQISEPRVSQHINNIRKIAKKLYPSGRADVI